MPESNDILTILVTGAQGFVGGHLAQVIKHSSNSNSKLIGTSKEAGTHAQYGCVAALDVTDYQAVKIAIRNGAPTHVVHLAGISAPSLANADPNLAWRVHVDGTLNLARAILEEAPNCWLLHAGSGLVYGESARLGAPLNEGNLLAPADEYAVTKAAADLALGALARKGLKCVRLRPFNHTGPGQNETFVVPALAMQIARIEAGRAPPLIRVGNLDAERDFLDVRDVVKAYLLAAQKCEHLDPGIILNIASGSAQRVRDILSALLALSGAKITVEQDAARIRTVDLPRIVGDSTAARERLGWKPEYPFANTLAGVLNYCRDRITSK